MTNLKDLAIAAYSGLERWSELTTVTYEAFDGIMVPTKPRVYAIDSDGTVNPEPSLLSIDLNQVRFE
jgi:hypothetical protein